MKWVVQYDLDNGHHYYTGCVQESAPGDPPEKQRKVMQVVREVKRISQSEYEEMNMGKTEKDRDDERKFKA